MKTPVSMKRYMSLHIGVVAILPIITIAFLVWFFIMPNMQSRTVIKIQTLAHSIAGQISTYLEGGERQLTALADYLQDRQLQPNTDPVRLLDAQCGNGEFFETLFVVDNTETVIQSVGLPTSRRVSREDFIGLDLSGRKIANSARGLTRAIWSHTFLSTVSSRMAVALTIPLTDSFIIGEITLDRLSAFIRHLPVESEYLTMVIDAQGQVVADSSNLHWGEVLGVAFNTSGGLAAARTFELDGERMLGTIVEMDAAGWSVLVAQPIRQALQPLRETFLLIALGLAVALVLALSVAWFLAGRFSGVFSSYADQAEAIAGGRYNLKWPKARTKEASRLGQSLIRMAARIGQREKELVESEARLRNITVNVPGVVYQFRATRDHAYILEFIGEHASDIFELEPNRDTFQDEFKAHIPDDEKGRFIESIRKTVEQADTWNYEGRFIKSNGETIWFSGSAIPNDEGESIVYYGMLMDITRRKQDEEELHRLRKYLSNIIDSMPSVLVGVDSEGVVTQWNRRAEQVTGIRSEEACSQHLGKVFPNLMHEMNRIETSIRERRVISDPKVARKIEHEVCYEDVTIYPLVTNGVEGAVIRVDDVTQQVRLEEMMIQSEKMLSVGGLAAGMAHEINNPLAGILQNASVLTNRLTGDLPANHKAAEEAGTTMEAIRNYLAIRNLPGMIENIRASGSRAAAIVKNMLSFARKSDKAVSSQDLAALLDQALELVQTDYDMKKQYDFKQIRLVREYDDATVPVPCEASKIQQVFMNILKNGAEAMAGMPDTLAPPAFVLRVRNDGDWVRVEIEDNGPGIDEATRRRIFEPFFTTKPVGQGTGLGLSVSYFIVAEDHGGEMRVHAAEGGGTRFVILLPR